MKIPWHVLFLVLCCLWQSSCGANLFSAAENEDPAISATVALEQNDASKAISILEKAIKKSPNNYTYRSLLSTAKAQKAGIDFLRIVLKLADTSSTEEEGASDNQITLLFTVLPEPTTENLSTLDEAITLMESIPTDQRLPSDEYKLTIFLTSRVSLRTKKFDTNGDGVVSPVELLSLGDDDADVIIDSIINAGDALEAAGASGASAEQIEAIQTAIDSSEGSTTAEKLRNYLGGTTTTT